MLIRKISGKETERGLQSSSALRIFEEKLKEKGPSRLASLQIVR
jgi:hypothetical protein